MDERMGFVVKYHRFSPLIAMSFKYIAKRIVNFDDDSYNENYVMHINDLIIFLVNDIKTKLTISCKFMKIFPRMQTR